ncbi:MAG: hypothetical protein HY286_11350 [Planctomycetes bacterium]|nr:hypothetical protein [Planctomycetota bacterium]
MLALLLLLMPFAPARNFVVPQEPPPIQNVNRFQSMELAHEGQSYRIEQDEYIYIFRKPEIRAPDLHISAERGVLILDARLYKQQVPQSEESLKPGPSLPAPGDRDLLADARRRAGGAIVTKGPLLNLHDAPFREALRVMYLEGDVRIFQDNDKSLSASAMYLDLTSGRLVLIDGRMRFDMESQGRPISLSVRAKLLRQEITGVSQLTDADLTLCNFAVPHYHVHASDLSLTSISPAELQIDTTDSSLQFEDTFNIPLPDSSLYSTDLRYLPLESISVGHSRRDGTFVRTRWGHGFRDLGKDFNESIGVDGEFRGHWSVDVDMLGARGPALGGTLDYATPGHYRGTTTFFLLNDHGNDRGFLSNVYDERSANRGRFHTENRIVTGDRSWLDVEVSAATDPLLRSEFFPGEFKSEKEHENLVYYRTAGDTLSFTGLAKTQINAFEPIIDTGVMPGAPSPSETNALPFVDGRFYPASILELPIPGGISGSAAERGMDLIYRARADAGYLERHYGEGDISSSFTGPPPLNPLDQRAFRFDTVHELSTPFSLAYAKLIPYFEVRETLADRSIPKSSVASGLGVSEDNLSRLLLTAGARVGSHLEHDYGLVRHLFDLRADYRNQFESTEDGNRFIKFDSVDPLDIQKRVDLEMQNRLSTRDSITGTRWTFADWRIFAPYYPEPGRDNGGRTFGDVRTDARLDFGSRFVIPDLRVRSRARLDPYQFFTQKSDTTVLVSPFGAETDLSVSYRESHADYRAVAIGLSTRIDRKWDLDVIEQYDFEFNRALQQKVALRRYGHDFAIEISFSFDTNDNSQSISIAILPLLGSGDRPRDRFFIPEPGLRGFY